MKNYKAEEVTRTENVLESITCDVCGTTYDGDDLAVQEFLQINYQAGYGAELGDTNHIECDICEKCVIEKLGKYLRVTETDNHSIDLDELIEEWDDWDEERNLDG